MQRQEPRVSRLSRDRTILWSGTLLALLFVGVVSKEFLSSAPWQWIAVIAGPLIPAVIGDRILSAIGKTLIKRESERLDREQLAEMNRALLIQVNQDPLTGLHNRLAVNGFLTAYRESPQFRSQSLSIVMLDIDQFKTVNDQYGHLVGDQVLSALATLWKGLVRRSDLLARFGGDEFCLILPNTTLDQASMVAEKIRAATAGRPLSVDRDGQPFEIRVSVSLGLVTTAQFLVTDERALISAADRALYEAKAKGRDRVVAMAYGG